MKQTEDRSILETVAGAYAASHPLAAAASAALAVGDSAHIAATADLIRRHAPKEATVLAAAKKQLVARTADYAPSVFASFAIEATGNAAQPSRFEGTIGYALTADRRARILIPFGAGSRANPDVVKDAAVRIAASYSQGLGGTLRSYAETLTLGDAIEFGVTA